MAINLNGITLTAPTTDPELIPGQSFQIIGTGSYIGTGAISPHNLYCEWSTNNVTWTTIGSSGVLTTSGNPVNNKTDTSSEQWTVTINATGTFYVRVAALSLELPLDPNNIYESQSQAVSASVVDADLPTFRQQYYLEGSGVGFVNSDDNKIIITGYAPSIEIEDSGIERPTLGTLSLTGQAPKAIGIVEIPTDALTIATTRPVAPESPEPAKDSLALSGSAPTLGSDKEMTPAKQTLSLAGQSVERTTGLKLDGFSPTTVVAEVVDTAIGALTFASEPPDVESSSATVITRLPQRRTVTITGSAPTTVVGAVVQPLRQVLDFNGRLVFKNPVDYPSRGALALTGYAPQAINSDGQVIIIVEGPFNFGTIIRNADADTDVPVNYQIDDRTGFKVKVKDTLMREYTGHLVRPDSLDKRSEQEFLRSRSDGGRGPQRPEPVGDETFVEDNYPDGVSADDL